MKKNYKGYIESENFGQSRSFVAFKMNTEDWSAYRRVSIITINWIFSPKRLNQNLQTSTWNEEKLLRIHWIRKFWPISKFCCLQNDHRILVGLPARVCNRYKLNFFSKTAQPKFTNERLKWRKTMKDTLNQKILANLEVLLPSKWPQKTGRLTGACL